jgi:hypothetical protein
MRISPSFAAMCLASALWSQTPEPVKTQPCIVDTEDGGPPRLKRGKPGERNAKPGCETLPVPIGARPSDERSETVTPPRPSASEAGTVITTGPNGEVLASGKEEPQTPIERARDKSAEYTSNLPNFICEQLIRRYSSGGRRDWKLHDFVTVDVSYVDGREDYKNAKRNGKKMGWEETQKSGSWSEGEYGSVLNDLLHPTTDATFTYRKKDTVAGVETDVYDYIVQKDRSHWTLRFGGQTERPKYRGRIWLDPKSMLVRRIEMEALQLPSTFPVNHAEMTLDYGPVRISGKEFLLPTKTENLACFTGQSTCTRNETEFRNYRRFSTESNISTTESTVSFEEEKKPPVTKK